MPESCPPLAPPSSTSLPGIRGQQTPPQLPNAPLQEPPASLGPHTPHRVLLVSTALGMTHYSVSQGGIRPEICVPRVHLAVSQLPNSPFLPSLPNPNRVLHTLSRSPYFSPLPALSLSFTSLPSKSGPPGITCAFFRYPYPLPVPTLGSSTSPSLSPISQGGSKKVKGRKIQPGFSGQPSVFLGRLRRPVPGGSSGPGFACSCRPPPGASAPGSGANRRLVIAGARRRLGPRVLRCPRARPGAPPPAAPGARRRRARFQPRPRQTPRRPLPTRAHCGHCGEPEPSARELSALRRPRPAVCRGGPG